MTKWAARTALGLSNSVPGPILDAENILYEDDIGAFPCSAKNMITG
jgi:RNA-dependent RNA polymerase